MAEEGELASWFLSSSSWARRCCSVEGDAHVSNRATGRREDGSRMREAMSEMRMADVKYGRNREGK